MEIIFATTNSGKLKEIREMIKNENLNFNVISLDEAGKFEEIIEDGITFEENALKKATEIMKITKKIVIADDSGLEIDFLNKEPGVYSARYMGVDTPYEVKNTKILKIMENVPFEKRTARFVSAIAVAFPDNDFNIIKVGTLEGFISFEAKGENGFGYDPIFYIPDFSKTSAEISMEEKNNISHRGKALRMVIEELKKIL